MGFIGSMLGSSSGSGFQAAAPGSGQLDTAYDQTQAAIKQQQDFVNSLGQQGGLANQQSVFGQQQNLANQLQGVANGTGPNPAQAQLAQNTAANTANQAALMAGQRGSSQNAGLIARQAAMQGAQNQQGAVGQAATLQAQQQLAAMQQLQNQQASMGNMANTQVGQQQAGISALNQYGLQQQSNLMGLQASANAANASIAGQNAGAQSNLLGGVMGGIGSAANLIGKGGVGGAPGAAGVGGAMPSLIGDQTVADGGSSLIGGGVTAMAKGGEIDSGNPLSPEIMPQQVAAVPPTIAASGPQSNVGKMLNDQYKINTPAVSKGSGSTLGGAGMAAGVSSLGSGAGSLVNKLGTSTSGLFNYGEGGGKNLGESITNHIGDSGLGHTAGEVGKVFSSQTGIPGWFSSIKFSDGGKVPALLSPGERYLSPDKVEDVKKGANPIAAGKKIPGKPKVSGAKDSYKNDTVKASLDEGGIVIPRSVTQSKDPEKASIAFVRACLAKNGHLPKKAK